jgi:carboxyl-terminal processing protease
MPKRNLIWILIVLAMGTVLFLIWKQPGSVDRPAEGPFELVGQAYEMILRDYYKPLDAGDLQQAAVRGMVEALDEFSTYVPPDQAQSLTNRVMGQPGGIGLVVARPKGETFGPDGADVIGALPGSPAHQAGLLGGQRILAVDETPLEGLRFAEARALLAGTPGTEVVLRYRPAAGEEAPPAKPDIITRTITREELTIETVDGLYRDRQGQWVYRLDGERGLYYVRIGEFCPRTPPQLQRALGKMTDLRGLVLDLRGNPGGVLDNGIAVAELFLADGPIVTVRDRSGEPRKVVSHSDTAFAQLPLVVLVDGRSASAAELVAGALARNGRAVLLGQRTRGKGCVQTMIRLGGDLGQVQLTTAEFYLDPDRPVQRRDGSEVWGVDPEISIAMTPETRRALYEQWRRERVISARPTAKSAPATQPSQAQRVDEILQIDPMLDQARALLGDSARLEAILAGVRARLQAKDSELRGEDD